MYITISWPDHICDKACRNYYYAHLSVNTPDIISLLSKWASRWKAIRLSKAQPIFELSAGRASLTEEKNSTKAFLKQSNQRDTFWKTVLNH